MNGPTPAVCGILSLLLGLVISGSAADRNDLGDMTWEPEVVTNSIPNTPALWFPVGERLTYSIQWGLFHVATTTVSTDWVQWSDGRLLLRIQYRTRNNRVIAKLYPVDDLLTSYIDPALFLPVRFVKHLNEGSRHELAVTDFHHESGTARWRKIVRNFKDWTLPISADTRDIPTLSYWLRKDGFVGGATNQFQVMADDKIYNLTLTASDRGERFTLAGVGEMSTLRIDPEAAFEGLFVRTGKLTAWVSKGPSCLLTRMDAQVPVANIRIELSRIEGHPSTRTNKLASTATQMY